jgi:hypothetical protein
MALEILALAIRNHSAHAVVTRLDKQVVNVWFALAVACLYCFLNGDQSRIV